jgi:secondary thiamine-phosphate synthase enzyme
MSRSRGTVVSAVSSVSKGPEGTTTPADPESAWTQRVITLEPKSRGIFIWTDTLRASLPEMRDVRVGMVSLFLRSTTGALTVNENCDPDVRTDMQNALEAIVPLGLDEERAALVGCSLDLPVRDGRPALGTWQGLYLLASRAGPVEVVATLVATGQDCAKNVKLPAPSRGCHPARDALAAPAGAADADARDGVFLTNVLVKHTSASVTVNDVTDPRVCSALESALSSLVPESWNYPGGAVTFRHTDEGDDDMPAHVKSTLVGASLTVPVDLVGASVGEAPTRGVLLCEHRSGGGFGGSGATRDAVVTRVRCRKAYQVALAMDAGKECVDVTERLRDVVREASRTMDSESGVANGLVNVFVRHGSSGAFVVVGSSRPTFGTSFVNALDDAVRETESSNLREKVKASLASASATLPVTNGALALGDDQAVFFCERGTGGETREIVVTVCGD